MGALRIALESPHAEEVLELFRLSDEHAGALYPAESNHLVDPSTLVGPGARFLVARLDGRVVGCGAVRFDGTEGEIKRMFVRAEARGHGVGRAVLAELEAAARAAGVLVLRLETGVRSDDALALYERCGYRRRGPFGAYVEDPLSVFMEKRLAP